MEEFNDEEMKLISEEEGEEKESILLDNREHAVGEEGCMQHEEVVEEGILVCANCGQILGNEEENLVQFAEGQQGKQNMVGNVVSRKERGGPRISARNGEGRLIVRIDSQAKLKTAMHKNARRIVSLLQCPSTWSDIVVKRAREFFGKYRSGESTFF